MSEVVRPVTGAVGPGIAIAPDAVLDGAKGKLREAAVVGFTPDGETYVASTEGPTETLWFLERARCFLMENA